ncbi:MAG: carbamoyltransferase HypF [Candidatus Loosdrechtia sp.]|uniref:carbamoyltransferase HypF n=1 Tax=Candidatus Loosdrechtia sp. TaxID=3101272 RepID=UPI003A69801B|nr:MAG: carbamoyltransferase HypF [Candidatus Jettenia sp. AMX2]
MNPKTRITITGIVQGVGFRPFIYHLANKYNLKGFCLNNSRGVFIEVQGDMVDEFIREIKTSPPPLSKIEKLTSHSIFSNEVFEDFRIRESLTYEGEFALVSPDISVCHECLKELSDPYDRRYRYPFINCINCGPRYSIIRDIPYDRSSTTMASFSLCEECNREYHDPANRRFHAQPNACPACGPAVWLVEKGQKPDLCIKNTNYPAIRKAKELLQEGAIIAIKGLGGFHLACDATNNDAVRRLRERKRRSNKPFALMAPDSETVRSFCLVSEEEKAILEGRIRPIVILKKSLPNPVSDTVAPNNNHFGLMLPYTPLHYLLLEPEEIRFTALVMTSGNKSEETIVITNEESVERLSSLADFFLLHNRDIYMRVDDSIVRSQRRIIPDLKRSEISDSIYENQEITSQIQIIRRARGFVPETIDLEEEMADILACGAELKNTFCLVKQKKAILSQHIGDLQNYDTLEFFKECLKNLKNTFRINPQIIAHDLHPDYLSTGFALEYAAQTDIPQSHIIPVQHHHAHIVSCMTEHHLNRKVIGIAFDGTGYGTDGNLWGGEFLIAGKGNFIRKAHLQYIPMPGGDKAAKEPWRMAIAYLYSAFGNDMFNALPSFLNRFNKKDLVLIITMIKNSLNSPLSSSAGRLFDAVSSLLGICDRITFEGEAAIGLETVAEDHDEKDAKSYPFKIISGIPMLVDLKPLVLSIVEDINKGVKVTAISLNFHVTLATIIAEISKIIKEEMGIRDVILSGGVFQNNRLLTLAVELLKKDGFVVWTHGLVPANDGGISLGQAIVAWEKFKSST